MKLLTKQDLDANRCQNPNCTHNHSVLHFSPDCHSGSPMRVCYDRVAGAVIVSCAQCDREAMRFAPAEHGAYQ